jgi:hypothetical protein
VACSCYEHCGVLYAKIRCALTIFYALKILDLCAQCVVHMIMVHMIMCAAYKHMSVIKFATHVFKSATSPQHLLHIHARLGRNGAGGLSLCPSPLQSLSSLSSLLLFFSPSLPPSYLRVASTVNARQRQWLNFLGWGVEGRGTNQLDARVGVRLLLVAPAQTICLPGVYTLFDFQTPG